MRTILTALLIATITVAVQAKPPAPATPAGPNTAVVPVTRLEKCPYDWMARHEAELKLHETIPHPDLVMIGDSITHYWGGEPHDCGARGAKSWARLTAHRTAINMGFGWDRTQNVIWRLQHGELDGLNPKFVVLNIGTNNLAGTKHARVNTPQEIAAAIRQIVGMIREKAPQTHVILMGIFPRGRTPADRHRARIVQINALISKLAAEPNVTFLDIGSKFLSPDGTIAHDIMFDALHPTEKGYAIWSDALEKLFDASSH